MSNANEHGEVTPSSNFNFFEGDAKRSSAKTNAVPDSAKGLTATLSDGPDSIPGNEVSSSCLRDFGQAATASMRAESSSPELQNTYKVIGFQHMDMRKFAMFSLSNSVLIRTFIYPTTLIKTRLQCEQSGQYSAAVFIH